MLTLELEFVQELNFKLQIAHCNYDHDIIFFSCLSPKLSAQSQQKFGTKRCNVRFLTAILHRGLRNCCFFHYIHLLLPMFTMTFNSLFSLEFYFSFLIGLLFSLFFLSFLCTFIQSRSHVGFLPNIFF